MKHKWHDEIVAWANGALVECKRLYDPYNLGWGMTNNPHWDDVNFEYRIKPTPKEPQYLYVYQDKYGVPHFLWSKIKLSKTDLVFQGKIKLEVDDGSA